ncbi:MAG: histidinol-phosphatase [Pseudomonadota bacterium]
MTRDEIAFDSIDTVAQRLADAARAAILPFFRSPSLAQEDKDPSRYDPVTEADRAAERAMRGILKQERPEDAVLGEEYGEQAGLSGLTWVLDPIDGTRGFVSGTPTWGVLIAVSDERGPFYGLIDQPYIGERFVGMAGRASMVGPKGQVDLRTRATKQLAQATVFTTFPEVGSETEGAAFHRVAQHAKLTRYGMDCYAYALLAAGHVDLVVEAGLAPYDIQAPIALIEAAGGIVTDWSGGPAHDGGRALAAANVTIHAQAMKMLKDAGA